MFVSTLPFLLNVVLTHLKGKKVEVDDPWGYGASLEWATSCPPPRHNFHSLPRVRSERPAFDLHHPEAALQDHMLAEEPALNPRTKKSTRLNSSHVSISYAVFCLKKKKHEMHSQ